MPVMREPARGEIQIVVLLGATSYVGWAPAERVGSVMDSFEKRAGLTEADRSSRETQAGVRAEIARLLRGENAEQVFREVLAAGALWLSLRHWSGAERMRQGLEQQMALTGSAVITAGIADPAPEGMAPDTAWAFMVGSRVHDGRPQIAEVRPGDVEIR